LRQGLSADEIARLMSEGAVLGTRQAVELALSIS
jgi:hypothetical protein